MHKQRKIAWLVALAVGLMLIPVAGASASKKSEKKQNKAIAKVTASVIKVTKATAANTTAISAVNTKTDGVDTRLKLIEAGVPTIVQGLSDLKDASLALKDGLTQLKDGTTAGLTSLKTLITSTEYIVAQVKVGGTALPGCFITTPDIPDNGNQVTASTTCVNPPSATPLTGAITVEASCRSAESDGTGAADPCAQAGIVSLTSQLEPAAGGAPGNFEGFIASKPNGSLGGAPLYDIANKSPQFSTTDTTFPLALIASDQTLDLTQGSNSSGAAASTPTATALSLITINIRAFDRTASSTDPSA